MGRKELKQQNKDLEIHVVDIVSKFDPSETGKYTSFLIKLLKESSDKPKRGRLRSRAEVIRSVRGEFVRPKGESNIEEHIISYLTDVYDVKNLETLIKFHEHLENHRIDEDKRDINQYKSWDELNRIVSLATIKLEQKRLEKEVIRVLETEEWLAVRPLTIESSLTYGAGTKWCTASRGNHDYFYRYCNDGVLTYVINKKNGDKYGIMYNKGSKEFSMWNAPDLRIDSVESTIPSEIVREIYEMSKVELSNRHYFSQEEIYRMESQYGLKKVSIEEVAVPMNEAMDMIEEATPMDARDYDTEEAGELFDLSTVDEVVTVEMENGGNLEVVWRGDVLGEERVYQEIGRDEGTQDAAGN